MASGQAAPLVATVSTPSSVAAAKGAGMDGGLTLDQPEPPKAGPGIIPMDFDHNASHAAPMEAVEVEVAAATWNPPLWGVEGSPSLVLGGATDWKVSCPGCTKTVVDLDRQTVPRTPQVHCARGV